jgi:hypothetical protein
LASVTGRSKFCEKVNLRVSAQTRVLSFFFAIVAFLIIEDAWAGERQVLKGHFPNSAKKQKPIGRLPGPTRLDLILGLPLRNQAELTKLLEEIYDPFHTNYKHYLTPEQFSRTIRAH